MNTNIMEIWDNQATILEAWATVTLALNFIGFIGYIVASRILEPKKVENNKCGVCKLCRHEDLHYTSKECSGCSCGHQYLINYEGKIK